MGRIITLKGGNGAEQPRDMWQQFTDAILRVASARDRREAMERVKHCLQFVDGVQKAIVQLSIDKDRVINILRAESDGALFLVSVELRPHAKAIRFVDANDQPVAAVDPGHGLILVKPAHVKPISVVYLNHDETEERAEIADFTQPQLDEVNARIAELAADAEAKQ